MAPTLLDATMSEIRVVRNALAWLETNRHFFNPAGRLTAKSAKPAVELGLLIFVMARSRRLEDKASERSVARILDVFEQLAHRNDVRNSTPSSIADVLFHAVLCGTLDFGRRSSERHRSKVNAALASGVLENTERLGYHMMEEVQLLGWAGFSPEIHDLFMLARGSMLVRALSALHLPERPAYQLTHDIMFLVGLSPRSGLPEGTVLDTDNLQQTLADLIVSFSAVEHWDLLGELLLCWDCLHLPQEALYHKAWDMFLSQQDSDGSFPGPPPPRTKEVESGGDASRFGHRYHTTLVAIMALIGRVERRAAAQTGRRATCVVKSRARVDPRYCADRAFTWLQRPTINLALEEPRVASGILVGSWLSAAINPDLISDLPGIAERTTLRLQTANDFDSLPPALTLVTQALLERFQHTVPKLNQFVETIRLALADNMPTSALDKLLFCEKLVILHQMGRAKLPLPLSVECLCKLVEPAILRPTEEQMSLAILAAESSTLYGTFQSRDERTLAKVFERQAIHLLRSADLSSACANIRAANHLSPLLPERATEFMSYLALHQRDDGPFSLVDLQAEPSVNVNIDDDIYLPTILTTLWTLAELNSDFRLYNSIASSRSTVVGQMLAECL
jgi:hypothetical protein